MLLSPSPKDILQTRDVTGRVSEIHDRHANSAINANTRRQAPAKLVIAVVELSEGGHARVLVPRGRYSVGSEIQLTLTLYKNGDRKVVPRLPQFQTSVE